VIDIEIDETAWTEALPDIEKIVRRAALIALEAEEAGHGDVAFRLTDDAGLQALNRDFLGKDAPTNVLSFPTPPNPRSHLGDVALAFGVCAREANEQGKPLANHVSHLVVHGVLHLLGYDHIGDDEAEVMEDLERTLLAEMRIPDPYAAGEGEHERPRPL
jgi:probable rRNA maturation factor